MPGILRSGTTILADSFAQVLDREGVNDHEDEPPFWAAVISTCSLAHFFTSWTDRVGSDDPSSGLALPLVNMSRDRPPPSGHDDLMELILASLTPNHLRQQLAQRLSARGNTAKRWKDHVASSDTRHSQGRLWSSERYPSCQSQACAAYR